MSLDKAALAQRFMALDETKQAVFQIGRAHV